MLSKKKISLQTIPGKQLWEWQGMSDEAKNESVTYFAERAPLDALMKSIDASSKILKIPEVLTSSTGVDILEGISFSVVMKVI